jgi:hypothetical protein
MKINDLRALLHQWKEELESKQERAVTAANQLNSIERFCELAKRNLDYLTFEDKSLALEDLAISVLIDEDDIDINGTIPMCEEGTIVSEAS